MSTVIEQEISLNFDEFPDDVRRLVETARRFAQDEVLPRARELDEAPHDAFDWEIVRKGHEVGLTRAMLPPHYAGIGAGIVGVCAALEELAAACPGVALIFGATMLGQTPVLLSGESRLQSRFLPLFSGDDPVLACNAVCEEEAGVDLVVPESFEHARMVTTLRRDGDEYVLDGHKRVITNAAVARFAAVFANMAGSAGASGLTCVIVDLESPGVTRGPVADKMGYRACLGGELTFEDVRIPAENLVGGEGDGGDLLVAQGNLARASVAAISTGVARHALERAIEFCGQRVQGGVPIKDHQMSARKLAEMAASVDAARLLYLRAANKVDTQLPAPEYEPAVAKLFADRVAIDVAEQAVSLFGSRGYIKEFGVEKILRDAYGTRIYEGTSEALALSITSCLYRDDDDF